MYFHYLLIHLIDTKYAINHLNIAKYSRIMVINMKYLL